MGNAAQCPCPCRKRRRDDGLLFGGGSDTGSGFGYDAGPMGHQPVAVNEVQLAASPIGGMPGAQAYHTSVIVNGDEYSFSDGGVTIARGTDSHEAMARQNSSSSTQVQIKTEVFDMGMSQYSGSQLMTALQRHFQAGTYDLLKKNCNSFSDCALFYFLNKRIDRKYRALEKMGGIAPGLIASLSGGSYTPNPKSENFDLEKVILEVDPRKKWDMPGAATGGAVATSAEAMRAARLAALGGGGQPAAAAQVAAEAAPSADSAV